MQRFSLFTLLYGVAAFAVFFGVSFTGTKYPDSLSGWIVESVGGLYGTLIYATGLVALLLAVTRVGTSDTPGPIAAAIPVVWLPSLIGLVTLLHGYIVMYRIIASMPSYPKPSELFYAHAICLTRLLLGLSFSIISFTILSVGLIRHSRAGMVGGQRRNNRMHDESASRGF